MKLDIKLLAFFIFLIHFTVGLLTLSGFGFNWDETAHYLRGQAYLRFFLTGKTNYEDVPKVISHYSKESYLKIKEYTNFADESYKRSLFQYDREGEKFTYPYYLKYDKGHPPLNGILASLSNFIFFQKLGFLGDIESYHLFTVAMSSILVGAVFLFTASYFGIFSGLIAALSLSLYPLFFSESHFNVKDPVEATFYSLTLFAFYVGIIKNKWKWIIISGIFAGLALGTKFNIIFAGFTILAWLIVYYSKSIRKFSWPFSKSLTASLALYPFIALSILYASWPYLWQDPGNIMRIFSYYRELGTYSYQPSSYYFFGVNTYATQWILFATPVVILIFSLFGVLSAVRHGFSEKNKPSVFILLWLLVPIIRVSFSSSGIYGGVRQIMEFIPAMAILSGIGASYMVKWLHGYTVKNKLFSHIAIQPLFLLQLLLVLSFIPITLKLISIHPHQNVYFNELIGGLEGARNRNFADWGVTLGTSYNEGVMWLNKNAEKNAKVALVKGLHANIPRMTLRKDIDLNNRYYSRNKKNGEYIIEVTDYKWNTDIPEETRNYLDTLSPVYEVKVDGVPILTIWKNDEKHTKTTY